MRAYVSFFVTSVMSLGLVFLLTTRSFEDHEAPRAEVKIVAAATDAGTDAGDASAPAAAADAAVAPSPEPRPFRLVALGSDVGVVSAAVASQTRGVPRLDVAREADEASVVSRLTRGGDDDAGADAVVLSVVDFVHAYDKLRVLDPRVFATAGFARGGGALRGEAGALLRPLPATSELRVVGAPRVAQDGPFFDPAPVALALFAFDVAGVPPTRVRVVAKGTKDAASATFSTTADTDALGAKVLLSLTDVPRLLPVVLVARKATLDAHGAELRAVASRWHEGAARVLADPGTAARGIATSRGPAIDGPETALTSALATLDVGPDAMPPASGAASLEGLVGLAFHLLHGSGAVAGAPPEVAPVTSLDAPALRPAAEKDDAGAPTSSAFVPVLTSRSKDEAEIVARASLLAAVMPRARFRVSAPTGEKGATALAAAMTQNGVAEARLATTRAPSSTVLELEVLVPR